MHRTYSERGVLDGAGLLTCLLGDVVEDVLTAVGGESAAHRSNSAQAWSLVTSFAVPDMRDNAVGERILVKCSSALLLGIGGKKVKIAYAPHQQRAGLVPGYIIRAARHARQRFLCVHHLSCDIKLCVLPAALHTAPAARVVSPSAPGAHKVQDQHRSWCNLCNMLCSFDQASCQLSFETATCAASMPSQLMRMMHLFGKTQWAGNVSRSWEMLDHPFQHRPLWEAAHRLPKRDLPAILASKSADDESQSHVTCDHAVLHVRLVWELAAVILIVP